MQIFGKLALLSTSFLLSKTPLLMKEKSELTADYDVKRCQKVSNNKSNSQNCTGKKYFIK